MVPLYDMMMRAQQGEGIRAMARQFGLSETQIEQALEALMPAFSTGLKRNASNPADLGHFLQALASGEHAKYYENLQQAFTPDAMAEGNGILGHLFGSKEVSRAVAAQAAAATGIGEHILKQMLPILATSVMGGLFKQAKGEMPGQRDGGSGNVIADMMNEMMKMGVGAGAAPKPASPSPSPADNPFGQMLEAMFGGGMRTGRQGDGGRAAPSSFDNPLGQIFRDMMGGGTPGRAPEAEPEPEAPPERTTNPYDEIFGRMFESGREIQRGYQKDMESIFDRYLQGMNRQR